MYMPTVSLTDARATLPALLDRVEAGEEITLTRHGRSIAVLVSPEALRHRRLADTDRGMADLRELMERARREPLGPPMDRDASWADDLVAEIRADRDAE